MCENCRQLRNGETCRSLDAMKGAQYGPLHLRGPLLQSQVIDSCSCKKIRKEGPKDGMTIQRNPLGILQTEECVSASVVLKLPLEWL